jgi:PAS domain S-box-containing protein
LSAFLDSATESFFLFDSNLNMVEINRTAQYEFAIKKEEALNKPLSVFLKKIRFPVSSMVFDEVLNTGEPVTMKALAFDQSFMDFKLFRVGNGMGIIATNITEQKRAEDELQKAHAELEQRVNERTADLYRANVNLEKEISERKRMQEALAKREREFNALLNNLTEIAWLKDTESRFILINRALANWCGLSPEEIKGLTDFDLWPRELAERYVSGDRQVMQTGETLRVEEPIILRDGKSIIIETVKSPIRDEFTNIVGTVGIARDITERKEMEEALRRSEERRKLAMESSEEGMWDWNITDQTIFWSPRIPLMLGYDPSAFSGVPGDIVPLIHPDDLPAVKKIVESHLRGEILVYNSEHRLRCGNGEWKWIQDNGQVVARDAEGRPVRMVGTYRDITERKRTEEVLRENEERYRTIFENAGVALLELNLSAVKMRVDSLKRQGVSDFRAYIQDNSGFLEECYRNIKLLDVNQKTLDIYETDSKDMLRQAIDSHFPDDLSLFMIRLIEAIASNQTGMQLEFEGATLTGRKRYVMVNASIPLHDEWFSRVLISVTDLTERKQFEDALRRAHNELESRVRERTRVLARTNRELEKEIQEREKAERMLQLQADFRQHISAISTNFINLPIHEIDSGINQALKELGTFAGVDWGFVHKYGEDDETVYVTHEWYAENLDFRLDEISSFPMSWFSWTNSRLKQFHIVHVPRLSALPPEAVEDKKRCESWHVSSYITVPMIQGGKLTGFFVFGSFSGEKEWEEESFPLLKLVSEILVNALERQEAGEQIQEYQEELRSVASRLTLTEERERRRIAGELHDRIGQTLAVSKIKLGSIKEKITSPELAGRIDEVSGFINEAIRDTRSLIFEISPPVLYDLGLEAALEWLTDQMQQRHGIRAIFHDDGMEKRLENNMNVLLFQFVRELLVNVVKHAHAESVNVTIRHNNRSVEIEVEDDGIGFEFPDSEIRSTGNMGFGLFSIRERLDNLGGVFRIFSTPGHGARIVLSVPIRSVS